MNFTELQSELRSIGKRVEELESAVEQMKPTPEEEREKEYEMISSLANKYPLKRNVLISSGANTRTMYLKLLASIISMDEQYQKDRLLYLLRIAAGIHDKSYTTEKILELMREFDSRDLDNIYTDLEPAKDYFLIDVFVIAYLCGEPVDVIQSYVGEIAIAMKYTENEIKILAAVAKGVLTDCFDHLDAMEAGIDDEWCGRFNDVIPEWWFVNRRCFCGEYCISNGFSSSSADSSSYNMQMGATKKCTVKEKRVNGAVVKKGWLLAKYEEERGNLSTALFFFGMSAQNTDFKTITAPKDGIVYFDNKEIKNPKTKRLEYYMVVYVVSRFDDYNSFCQWYEHVGLKQLLKENKRGGEFGNTESE